MSEDLVRIAAKTLAVVGLAAAGAMYYKSRVAAGGGLHEPSVVELPESRLVLGVPNSLFGIAYYVLVIGAGLGGTNRLYGIAAVASLIALATSVYLAIKLIRQHLDCSRCWTAHVVNALLCPLLVTAAILSR